MTDEARRSPDHPLLADGRLRCATIVSVLACSGLRPGEALALAWDRIGERTIAVTGASRWAD